MTERFADTLDEIKRTTPQTCGKVLNILQPLWQNRPHPTEDEDWETEFTQLFAELWALSPCKDKARMDDFANADTYPVFATDSAVLEYHQAFDTGKDDPFAIHMWDELRETGQVAA